MATENKILSGLTLHIQKASQPTLVKCFLNLPSQYLSKKYQYHKLLNCLATAACQISTHLKSSTTITNPISKKPEPSIKIATVSKFPPLNNLSARAYAVFSLSWCILPVIATYYVYQMIRKSHPNIFENNCSFLPGAPLSKFSSRHRTETGFPGSFSMCSQNRFKFSRKVYLFVKHITIF